MPKGSSKAACNRLYAGGSLGITGTGDAKEMACSRIAGHTPS